VTSRHHRMARQLPTHSSVVVDTAVEVVGVGVIRVVGV